MEPVRIPPVGDLPPETIGVRLARRISLPALTIGLLGAVTIVLLLVNCGASVLKENPLFWRNAGGYPIALREAVLWFFYPLLGLNAFLCCLYSILLIRHPTQGTRLTLSLHAALWALLFVNVGIVLANNIENLLEGRPMHYHPKHVETQWW